MEEPTSAAPTTAEPTAEPTAEEFKERFPGAEQAEPAEPAEEDPTKPSVTRVHLCSDGKYRNNEQYEVYKKYEERLELKKQQFKKNPDQFIHEDDVIMAVVQGDKGRGCIFGRYTMEECKAALVTLQIHFFTSVQEFNYKMEAKQAQEKGLVGPDGKPLGKKPGIIT